jgi:hypothetical protein
MQAFTLVSSAATTRQISLIWRHLGRHCHALVSAPIGGYLRAACRPLRHRS